MIIHICNFIDSFTSRKNTIYTQNHCNAAVYRFRRFSHSRVSIKCLIAHISVLNTPKRITVIHNVSVNSNVTLNLIISNQ